MSRKGNKGLDRRGRWMVLMWLGIWLVGSLWSGLHGGNGLLTAVWHGFLTMAACMGLFLLGGCLYLFPEMWREEQEKKRRRIEEWQKEYEIWKKDNPGNYDYTRPSDGDSGCIPFS